MGCRFESTKCSDVKKKDTKMEIKVDDAHEDQTPYTIKFVLEDELKDMNGHCYIPVHPTG